MNAQELATEAHKGQFRRDDITPYIEHPKQVASIVAWSGGSTLSEWI